MAVAGHRNDRIMGPIVRGFTLPSRRLQRRRIVCASALLLASTR